MAPKQRKKPIPTNKTPVDNYIPPPPPPLKDDTSDYNSGSESESDISEVTPQPPPPPPPPKPVAPHPPLKQQTLMSSYSGSYKATILRLLREDQQVQEVLAETILRITGNGVNITAPSDGDLRNRLLRLLQEDAQLRDVVLSIRPKSKPRKPKPKATTPDTQPPHQQQPTPAVVTNLPFEKRTLAFLRANAHTALTYEEFAEQAEITDADLECILQKGFVEGFSTLILRNLTILELSQRSVLSFARDNSAVYVKIGPTRWKRDAPPQSNTNKRTIENEIHTSEVAIAENKGGSNKWEYLSEMVFAFSQKVDIKIAELRSAGPSDGWTMESWNDRLDRVRKQASGGIDRIRLISDICRQIADGAFVEV